MSETLKQRVQALELRVVLLSKRLSIEDRLAANAEFARECAALGWLREGVAEAEATAAGYPARETQETARAQGRALAHAGSERT